LEVRRIGEAGAGLNVRALAADAGMKATSPTYASTTALRTGCIATLLRSIEGSNEAASVKLRPSR
jgi:hypothetical protein